VTRRALRARWIGLREEAGKESYEAHPGRSEGMLFRISIALIVIGLFFLVGLRIAN
jgi:hypothetical protein